MRGRSEAWLCASVMVAMLLAGAPARADDTDTFYEIETKYIFGFTTGSGIGLEGEKEFSPETIMNFGKRDGRYAVSATKFEYEFTPNQYIQIELGPIGTYYDIRNVTGLDDMNAVKFGGFFTELRYLLFDRGANQPLAITLSAEPEWHAFDETSGARVVNYGLETKVNADLELITNRLYLGGNLLYEPETTRGDLGVWGKESTFGQSLALAYRIRPDVTIGAEAWYLRHYEGLSFNTLTGDAVYVGPTLYVQLASKAFMTAAWNTQVAGHEVGVAGPLDLTDFSRHRAKLKFAYEF
ncbi:MAG TPA: hypothetical protein VGX95_06655 [Xanthobacteraceae bacterium]|jgi:hypothetical protein|nr:hypothetical protein [Xanthobacteraceae bacterium]